MKVFGRWETTGKCTVHKVSPVFKPSDKLLCKPSVLDCSCSVKSSDPPIISIPIDESHSRSSYMTSILPAMSSSQWEHWKTKGTKHNHNKHSDEDYGVIGYRIFKLLFGTCLEFLTFISLKKWDFVTDLSMFSVEALSVISWTMCTMSTNKVVSTIA